MASKDPDIICQGHMKNEHFQTILTNIVEVQKKTSLSLV